MKATEFVKWSALLALCFCSANLHSAKLSDNIKLAPDEEMIESRNWQVRYDHLGSSMMKQSVGDRFDDVKVELNPLLVDPQSYLDARTSYLTKFTDQWWILLTDNFLGFSFNSHAWSIGDLID